MQVLILHDAVGPQARTDELDVLVQRDAVMAALRDLGHEVATLAFDLDLAAVAAALAERRPGVVFNLVESVAGQGRLIHLAPALLESLGVPFTGSPGDAVYVTSNKRLAKQVLRGAGLPTPASVTLDDLRRGEPVAPGRYIVKSIWEHGSLGLDDEAVVEVEDAGALRAVAERRAASLGGDVLAEAFIDGREFNLSVLAGGEAGAEVLPPAEIEFPGWEPDRPRIVGYRAKWDAESFDYQATPRRFDFPTQDGRLLQRLGALALECWRTFELGGWVRVDFRVDGAGEPWILEVNTNPCLSPDAGFAAAVERAGLSFSAAIARILDGARR